jgi:hypothetical protein
MSTSKKFTLSRYFPEGTEYFYGYPAEEDSHFFNGVPPEVEELVAARPLVCAGPNVKAICFEATVEPFVWDLMHELGSLKAKKSNLIVLPSEINNTVTGPERNRLLRNALLELSSGENLVMAQPFLDGRLKEKFRIPSHRSIWLNDKKNLSYYVPPQYLAKTYDEFLDGLCFEECLDQIALPCVVKVSSSSSGDGVRICRTKKQLEKAKDDFAGLEGIILISELVDAVRNFGVQFGIPEDKDMPPEIIMWHEQLTSEHGVFMGGIIEPGLEKTPLIKSVEKVILEKILPEVRRRGWYGVGGFDILMDKEEQFYIIDPNFRMTGMTVYDLLTRNGEIKKSSLSFMGTFEGSQKDFKKIMLELATVGSPKQRLHLTTLTEHNGLFRFNAALLFDHRKDIPKFAKEVLKKKIQSSVLENAAVQ